MKASFKRLRELSAAYPMVRGMISYSIFWPLCSITQEYFEHGYENIDWARAGRFGLFGAFFMSPVYYTWMRYSSRFFKEKNLKTAVTRALVEQVTYSPLALAYFFFGLSLLEGRSVENSIKVVKDKFWSTYKIGILYWPVAQTMNFYFVCEKNRLYFVNIAGYIWTVFLAHVTETK